MVIGVAPLFLVVLVARIACIPAMVPSTPALRLASATALGVFVRKVDDLIIFDYELRWSEEMSAR